MLAAALLVAFAKISDEMMEQETEALIDTSCWPFAARATRTVPAVLPGFPRLRAMSPASAA